MFGLYNFEISKMLIDRKGTVEGSVESPPFPFLYSFGVIYTSCKVVSDTLGRTGVSGAATDVEGGSPRATPPYGGPGASIRFEDLPPP